MFTGAAHKMPRNTFTGTTVGFEKCVGGLLDGYPLFLSKYSTGYQGDVYSTLVLVAIVLS